MLLFQDNPSEKDINQGTLVVFNLESTVSNEELLQIFGVYGEIKEVRQGINIYHCIPLSALRNLTFFKFADS